MARLLLTAVLLVPSAACGRHRLDQGELERNRFFAEILEREDRRTLEDDGFFPRALERSPHPEVRAWAARALGRIGDARALPWLRGALRSPYARVRAAAAFGVGEIESAAAAGDVIPLLDDRSLEVRMRAVEALGKMPSGAVALEVVPRLKDLRYDGSPHQRTYWSLAITALMRQKAGSDVLEGLARSPDPEIQWRAVNALYRMKDKLARPTFIHLVASGHPDVRAHAARALGICESPSLVVHLTPLVGLHHPGTGERNPLRVRVSAVQALGNLKNPAAIPAIRAALEAAPIRRDNPEQIQFAVEAAAALGKIGTAEAEPVLAALLDASGPVANAAVAALGTVLKGDPMFFAVVGGRRFEEPAAIRAWARALGEVGGPESIARLNQVLIRSMGVESTAPEALAVPAVLEALARAGAPEIDATLEPFLGSQDGVVLRAAVSAHLAAHENDAPAKDPKKVWGPLLGAYGAIAEQNDPETKVAIVEALAQWIREPEVLAALRKALADRQRNVRLAAGRILRAAGADGVPEDVGPSESTTTELTYDLVASARKERTLAILETERGRIEIELFREDAPLTVANFVALVRRSYYDGLTFMRVVPYFVVQGGDPRNDQEGGPGYTIRCEINMRPYERGSVGMALSGKDTGGSQFFITLAPQPHLDGGYTNFGRVVSGMAAVERLVAGDRILKASIQQDRSLLDFRRY